MKLSICGDCANCVGNCSWSAHKKPVEGWKAKPTKLLLGKDKEGNKKYGSSYRVDSCPQFITRDDSLKKRKTDSLGTDYRSMTVKGAKFHASNSLYHLQMRMSRFDK